LFIVFEAFVQGGLFEHIGQFVHVNGNYFTHFMIDIFEADRERPEQSIF
jgi:hypothetical protein